MDRWRGGIAGGVAATITMLVLFLFAEAEAQYRLGIGTLIARYTRLPDAPLVSLVVFFLVGVFVWPLVYAYVGDSLTHVPYGSDPAVRGLVFGGALWIVFVFVTRPGYVGVLSILTYSFTLFAHLVYGFTLGAVTAVLSQTPTPSTPA